MLDSNIYPKIDLNTYRKETHLKDGTKIILRPMVTEDKDAMYEFFQAVPEEDARYLRDEVSSRLLIQPYKTPDSCLEMQRLSRRDGV